MTGQLRRCVVSAWLTLALVACSGTGDQMATGVVIDVDGGIAEVQSFVLRLPDGTDQVVVPAPGILFHDDAAIGHVRDHLRTGEPITIRYEVLDDGRWSALEVGDSVR